LKYKILKCKRRKKLMKKLILLVLCACLIFTSVACSKTENAEKTSEEKTTATTSENTSTEETTQADSTAETGNGLKYKDFMADGKIKIAFVCKFLSSVWFAPKSEAMAERAKELGIEFIPIDANNKEDQCLQGVDNAIAQDVDGIILTAVNQSLVAPIAQKCHEAGVALITTDDPGVDENGNPIPHVGLDDYALGAAAARKMIEAAAERSFFDDPSKLTIAVMDVPRVEGFHKRLLGGMDVIKEKYPDLPESTFVVADTKDGLVDNVLAQFSNIYQAHRDTEYWIILGGDEGATAGTYPILEENNVDIKKVLWSTIAGSTMITDHMAISEDTANATFFSGILSRPSGKTCIDVLYNFIAKGEELPAFTAYEENVCDASNYKENFLKYIEE